MKLIRHICLSVALLCLIMSAASAQAPKLDNKAQAEVVNKIADLLRDNYVFPDVGEQAGKFVQSQQSKGAYTNATGAQDFSERLTHDLQSISHDKAHAGIHGASGAERKRRPRATRAALSAPGCA